jgi:hypothetical protein
MSEATFVLPEATRTHILPKRGPAWPLLYYFGRHGDNAEGPQAFHASREPHRETRAHFHHVDQFQIFFGAEDSTFQHRLTGPLLLHYSDADTLYGPFASGDHPFSFMTLRRNGSNFKGEMPKDRVEMSHSRRKRHFQCPIGDWLEEPIPDEGSVRIESLADEYDDTLAAFKITAPPSAHFIGPDPDGTGGQYYVVITGRAVQGDIALPPFTVGWTNPHDVPPSFVTANEGLRMVVLQFGTSQ